MTFEAKSYVEMGKELRRKLRKEYIRLAITLILWVGNCETAWRLQSNLSAIAALIMAYLAAEICFNRIWHYESALYEIQWKELREQIQNMKPLPDKIDYE